MIKKDKGVTLVALTIAVIIILIITGMIVYSAKDSVYVKNLTNMRNDISNLKDKVSLYYSEYGEIPAETEYPNISNLQSAGVIGANDTGKFLIIELENLDGLTLNYGKDYEKYKANDYTNLTDLTDIYIINENSHNIFYVQGVSVKENDGTKMYYTDYTEGDKEEIALRKVIDGVLIPEGFYYVGGKKDSGIVISDNKNDEDKYENQEVVGTDVQGNQYVWIPVDGILGEDGKTIQNAIDGEIILGRYVFDSNGDIDTDLTPTTQGEEIIINGGSYIEGLTGKGNIIAKDIESFINSVRKNGGYYIARYEASKGTNNKAESKYNKAVWTEITQQDSAEECQDLYTEMNSDLINSYAWDTAILFIQKYGQSNYSRQTSLNSSKQNTGISGDKQLNIYDMASNVGEYCTETSLDNLGPCEGRGGDYQFPSNYTSNRGGNSLSYKDVRYGFRVILYE